MIKLFYGTNDYELTQRIKSLRAQFDGASERYDAADLSREALADVFAGQTLFALKRLVIIDNPSTNADLWPHLPEWADRLSEDTELILVEPAVDKRTSIYKWLRTNAELEQFTAYDERDTQAISRWIMSYAEQQGASLTPQQARRLIERNPGSQWELAHAIDKFALLDSVTDQWIDDVIETMPAESAYALVETALLKDREQLQKTLTALRQTEDPYRTFGLISSQILQLCALVYGQGNVATVARDIGAKSSYPLQKLAPHAKRLNRSQAAALVHICADSDSRLKSSDADAWLVLESTLHAVASL